MAVQLGDKAIGDIVKIKIAGQAREFIVVQKGKPSSIYPDSFNDGVILMMKNACGQHAWDTNNGIIYSNSTIHAWLNNEFLSLIDDDIRNQIIQVKIPYCIGNNMTDWQENGLAAYVYILSRREVTSASFTGYPADGYPLSYFAGEGTGASVKRTATFVDGSACVWWLRTPSGLYNTTILARIFHRKGIDAARNIL